jgi:hypothetical protein
VGEGDRLGKGEGDSNGTPRVAPTTIRTNSSEEKSTDGRTWITFVRLAGSV